MDQSSDISSATDYLFLPFRGLFDFNSKKSRPKQTSVGDGLCFVNKDATSIVVSTNYSCPLHFYCPNVRPAQVNPVSLPSICPPTLECQVQRLSAHFCAPQGVYEPQVCPRGYYCPDYKTKIICPPGTFCPAGSVNPRECFNPFAICPEGSAFHLFYGGVLVCLIIDFLLVVAFLALRCNANLKERKRSREESRKISGRHIGTISETLHTKKRASFITSTNSIPEDQISLRMAYNSLYGQMEKIARFFRYGFKDRNKDKSAVVDSDPGLDIEASYGTSVSVHTEHDGTHSRHILTHKSTKCSLRKPNFSLYLNDLLKGFQKAQNGENLSLSFDFNSLSLTLPSGKTILNGVTGKINPGRVTVIMGPSGCGKSTLMNVLMGKLQRTGGRLLINGREIETHLYKKIVGYVPQDDVMLYELSVKENIMYSAKTRLPRSWSTKEIENFVDAVLDCLDLSHVADNLITSISGGQRKRVNIGMELVTCPSAIFLDEPTSGLDSTAALKVANTMKKIATVVGISIVAVIHQPRFEIFEEFDDLLMIASGGRTVYMGPCDNAVSYFQNLGFEFPPKNNPADILMDIIGGKGQKHSAYIQSSSASLSQEIELEEYEIGDLVQEWKNCQEMHDPAIDHINESSNESENSTICELNGEISRPASINKFYGRLFPLSLKKSMLSLHESRSISNETVEQTDSHKRLEMACYKRGSGLLHQIWHVHNRSVLQQYRLVNAFLLELSIATIAGTIIGLAVSMYDGALYQGLVIRPFTLISPSPIELVVPMLSLIQSCAIGLAGAPAGVKIFSEEREIYFREMASGLNPLAYYIGKNIAATYRFVVSSLHFTSLFMFFARPNIAFTKMYLIHLSTFFAVYGMSFAAAMLTKRENASMIAVCLTLIMSVLCGSGPSLTDMRKIYLGWILDLSYARWAAEAWYSEELLVFDGVFEIWDVSSALFGYTLNRFIFDITMIIVIGGAFRVIGFLLMIFTQRHRQR